jgi:ribose-phosphate pyrophosphokinase
VKILYTRACSHIQIDVPAEKIQPTVKIFSDGELYIKIDEQLTGDYIWVIASTQAPAENIVELLFILDILTRMKAHIHIMLIYYGYARQDHPHPQEAASARVIACALQQYSFERFVIVHPHSQRLHEFLTFESLIPIDMFCSVAQRQNTDIVIAPDSGAASLAQTIAQKLGIDYLIFEKSRPEQERVERGKISGNIRGKKLLLVDDIISTGRTLVSAAQIFKEQGALSLWAAATHGIFAPNARELLQSAFEYVYVTNTVAKYQEKYPSMIVLDIAPYLVHSMSSIRIPSTI